MRFGAYRGTNTKYILNWNQLSQLKVTDVFGGGWIITNCIKQAIPKTKRYVLILTLIAKPEGIIPSTSIKARIFKCPSSTPTIKPNSIIVIPPNKGHIKVFNSAHTICANYNDIQIVPPNNIKQFQYSQSRSPTPKKRSPTPEKWSPIPKKQKPSKPKSPLHKIPTVTLSDLSSPESSVSSDHNNEQNHIKKPPKTDPPNQPPTKQQILQTSLGIDDSLAIAHDKKIVYNYAAQQIAQQNKIQKKLLENTIISPPNTSTLHQTLLTTPSTPKKRCFMQMNGYNGDDEMNEEKENININVGGIHGIHMHAPSPKKQKILNGKAQSVPVPMSLTLSQKKRIERNRLAALERLKLHRVNTEINRIYVVDLETTSFPPARVSADNGDVIIEIAIVQFNRCEEKLYKVKPILHCFIDPESYDKYPKNWKEAWIFQNGTAVDMVKGCGLNAKMILPQVRRILKGHYVTSFNTDFDLTRFLNHPLYHMECKEFECIMKMCGKIMNLIRPSLKNAAHHFLGFDYQWGLHNAMEDALTAAKILSQVVVDE